MRFEAKHKTFEHVCKRTSFKNIYKTLTESHQRRQMNDVHYSGTFSKVSLKNGTGIYILICVKLVYIYLNSAACQFHNVMFFHL